MLDLLQNKCTAHVSRANSYLPPEVILSTELDVGTNDCYFDSYQHSQCPHYKAKPKDVVEEALQTSQIRCSNQLSNWTAYHSTVKLQGFRLLGKPHIEPHLSLGNLRANKEQMLMGELGTQ